MWYNELIMKKYQLPSLIIGLSLVILPALTYGQAKQGPAQRNIQVRPIMMPPRGNFASSTRPFIGSSTRPLPPMRQFASTTRAFASTTRPEIRDNIRQQIDQKRNEIKDLQQRNQNDRKELRVDIFKLQQNNIVEQLSRALDNLKQVRGRIQNRIAEAEKNGKDMASVKALLTIADDKIAAASSTISTFEAYIPSAQATTSIQLDKPRQVGADAITSIKSAKDALNNVVVALAQSLGIKLGDSAPQATSTLPVANATSTSTSTKPCEKTTIMGVNGPVEVCNDLKPGQVY